MLLDTKLSAQKTHHAMGTVMTHKAFGLYAEDSLAAVCNEIARLERLLSRFLPDSEISRINESAGINSEKVSLETYEMLSKAVEFSRICPGCFDVTIEPLISVWNSCWASFAQPDELSIKQVLSLVNYQDLILDPWQLTAGLRNLGQGVDLGGIGKGYAGDKVREIFQNFDISSAYSNLGGNVVTLGAKPDGTPWHVGIQHPRDEDKLLGVVSVVNQSVVTSGDYQRYFIDSQGKRHHHILNPNTGFPAESGLISVSIITDMSMAADALSTILFVAGITKGLEFLRNFPETEAILVDSYMRIYVTGGLRYCFQADQGLSVTVLD